MGIFDKFKDLVGIDEYDEDEEYEEVTPAPSMERRAETRNSFQAPRPEPRHEGKVIPMNNSRVNAITAAFKLVVIEPSGFDECPKLVDSLKAKKPIIINLEKIETDTARKIFDFLSGATYALNGNVQKVANNIFVFAPENVDITAGTDNRGFMDDGNKKKNNPWR